VFVADSNNQRVKVYDLAGNYKRLIVTQGLPRGLVALDHFPGQDAKAPTYFVEVDTLSHDATIWTTSGSKVLNFGEQGSLDGQFSYPDGISRGSKNKLFIADTANGRVQVWGWPAQAASIPPAAVKAAPWCLIPLLLLPFLLLLRKKEFFATSDFVEAMIELDAEDLMPGRRRKWRTTEVEYEKIKLLDGGQVDMATLFGVTEYSESDAKAAMDKYSLDEQTAITITTAQRARLACSESKDLRKLAKLMEFELLDSAEFVAGFSKQRGKAPEDA
jgi:NHL repeat